MTCRRLFRLSDNRQLPNGSFGLSRSRCTDCHGHGERLKEKERLDSTFWVTSEVSSHILRCKKCKGEKTIHEKTRQEIFIEKGMADRQRIVLAGAGDQQVVQAFVHTLVGHSSSSTAWSSCW